MRGLLAVVAGYATLVAVLTAIQRSILFPAPPPAPVSPDAGALLEGRSPGGRRVVALWTHGPQDAPTAVYFHGNGMQLADSAEIAAVLLADGWSVGSVEYPGYGPLASDRASEEALIDVAEGAMALFYAQPGVRRERVVLVGQSLGTGVASALAARGHGGHLVLMTPFRSITAVAQGLLPWLPVGWMVRDRFDTEALAPRITQPVTIVHGTRDAVVPYAHGQSLARTFARATLVTVPGAGHNNLWSDHGPVVRSALREARGSE